MTTEVTTRNIQDEVTDRLAAVSGDKMVPVMVPESSTLVILHEKGVWMRPPATITDGTQRSGPMDVIMTGLVLLLNNDQEFIESVYTYGKMQLMKASAAKSVSES